MWQCMEQLEARAFAAKRAQQDRATEAANKVQAATATLHAKENKVATLAQ